MSRVLLPTVVGGAVTLALEVQILPSVLTGPKYLFKVHDSGSVMIIMYLTIVLHQNITMGLSHNSA